jgi:hypothetical protein
MSLIEKRNQAIQETKERIVGDVFALSAVLGEIEVGKLLTELQHQLIRSYCRGN